MKNVNLCSVWNGLVMGNYGYQYFAGQHWDLALHNTIAYATALLCVYFARKASKP